MQQNNNITMQVETIMDEAKELVYKELINFLKKELPWVSEKLYYYDGCGHEENVYLILKLLIKKVGKKKPPSEYVVKSLRDKLDQYLENVES